MPEILLDQSTEIAVANPTFRAVVQEGSLRQLPTYLDEAGLAGDRAFILTDANVNHFYGDTIRSILSDAGIEPVVFEMPAGEEHKTLEQAGAFVDQLSEARATRRDPVIALGGGVIGDLGGFVASMYNRGVPLVQVPTTLLAMVDSSIGGKTGVDHGGKNKTGSFYQPRLVVADPTVLGTLNERVYKEGFGEVAKYAMLDADFFLELEAAATDLRQYSEDNLPALGRVVARSVKQKIDVIAADPFEQAPNGRILLNYGHTLGHGLEAAGKFTELLHGEGVAIGMSFAARIAVQLGLAGNELIEQQTQLLQALGLPIQYTGKAQAQDILRHMGKDKKNTGSEATRFVLPTAIGRMVVKAVPNEIVSSAVEDFVSA